MDMSIQLTLFLVFLGFSETVTFSNARLMGIAKTISEQEAMEIKLRNGFHELFSSNINGSGINSSSYFMYVCDRNCFNSYETELVSAFLFAVLSGRNFVISPQNGRAFYDTIYDTSYGDWQITESFLRNKSISSVYNTQRNIHKSLADRHLTTSGLEHFDFEIGFTTDIVVMSGDHRIMQDLRRTKHARHKLPWLYQTHEADFIRLVHNGLFRVKDHIQDNIKTSLIENVGDHKLVCVDGDRKYTTFYNLLILASSKYGNSYKIYFTNHGVEPSGIKMSDYIKSKIVRIDVDGIIYKDTPDQNSETVDTMLRQTVQIHILKFCDMLISSGSSVGRTAAQLRRNPNDLYCQRGVSIFPCTRELIAGSFRDQPITESVDIVYLCNLQNMTCIFENY